MATAVEKRAAFAALHREAGAFVLANAWDLGSAKLLAGRGARALATTSAGHAVALGRVDGRVGRDEALAHAAALDAATPLPVSGDFENGYGDAPEAAAETVRLAAAAGLAGCSIEDASAPERGATAYPRALAVERIAAAAAAARAAADGPFTLTARADGVMLGLYDPAEALARLQAFEAAGADVLYAPMLPDAEALRRLAAQVSKPVNALAAGPFTSLSLADFAALGVRRVSLGSSLARVAHAAVLAATETMFSDGDLSGLAAARGGGRIDAFLKD